MTRTLIGEDYEGVQSLKITKGDLDPVTTPDSALGAFLFNSKDTIQTRLHGIEITSSANENGTYPVGSTVAASQRYRFYYATAGSNGWYIYSYKPSFFSNIEYMPPLTDFVCKNPVSGMYMKGQHRSFDFGNQPYQVGYVYLATVIAKVGEAGWKINYNARIDDWGSANSGTSYYPHLLSFINANSVGTGVIDLPPYTYADVITWNLPGDQTPLPAPAAPLPGAKAVVIDKVGLRIAKPGYHVDTATQAQLAVSPEKLPIKIIAADDIAIPVGTSYYNLDVPVPPGSICDIQYYIGDVLMYPAAPSAINLGADWQLVANQIQFVNSGIACRARFVVMANDKVSQTVGDNEVLRQFEFNGQNVVQFLRPGSANPPAFSDVIIDSRWPSLRIIKEGYFTVNAGAVVTNIPINTEGYFPFIKFMVTTAGQGNSSGENYTNCVRPPSVGMYKDGGQGTNNWLETGDTTYAQVTADNVAFHTFRGRIKFAYYTYNSSTRVWTRRVEVPDEVLGIRYYIFGIPKKDIP